MLRESTIYSVRRKWALIPWQTKEKREKQVDELIGYQSNQSSLILFFYLIYGKYTSAASP